MLPRKPLASAVLAISFVTLLYLVELIDVLLPVNLDGYGIVARSFDGLDGIVWAPLLHADWQHLFANTGPVVVFAFLAMAGGIGQWLMVTATIWLIGGLGVWLTHPISPSPWARRGSPSAGWRSCSFVACSREVSPSSRWLSCSWRCGAACCGGCSPARPVSSWQGHLFGALGGVLAAWLVARADRSRSAVSS